jgi:hypothetical protein
VKEANAKLKTLPAAPESPAMPTPNITELETLVPWNPARWSSLRATKSALIGGTTK